MRAVAEELNITPSAVSQRIRLLEDQLGTPVFIRFHRRLELTETGETLSRTLTPAFADIQAVLTQIGSQKPANRVRIAIYQTLASRWLVPRLPKLQDRWPDLSVEFETGMEAVNLRNPKIDMAIRVGNGDWPGCHALKLMNEVLVPICTPKIASRINGIKDLRHTTLIYSSNRPDDWKNWLEANNMGKLSGTSMLQFSNSSLAIDAAENGVGLALSQIDLVRTELDEGVLATPFDFLWETGRSYYLLTRDGHPLNSAATQVRDWLVTEAI